MVARFGQTPTRQRLLAGLSAALGILAEAGCQRVWLDGSFITAVEARKGTPPGDFDLAWDLAGVDLATLQRLEPSLDPLRPNRAIQRARFGGDLFFVVEPVSVGLLEDFQFDRAGHRKGLVLLTLDGGGVR